jgi:HK97 family phage prohead protease
MSKLRSETLEHLMEKTLKLFSSIKSVHEEEDDKIIITGLASTDAVDRSGDVILHSAWGEGIKNYKANPILLFNHNYDTPIGKVTDIKILREGLKITGEIYKAAGNVYELIKTGVLTAFSVGFMPSEIKYNEQTDGFIIKKAELLEVSVVSVPCNQTALFSVAKSFDTQEEYEEFKSVYLAGHSLANKEVNASGRASDTLSDANASMEKIMDPEEIKKLALEAAQKAMDDRAAAEKALAEEAARKAAEQKSASEAVTSAISSGLTEGAERLYADIEKKMSARDADAGKILDEKLAEIKAASEALTKMHDSKRSFLDRGNGDWKTDKKLKAEAEDAVILGLATRKGLNTDFAKSVMQKVNEHSGVQVSSADFEQEVSSNIERDVQLQLVLAPLFREITLRSATQIIPILPDSGYAEITSNQAASGSSPHGNIASRGDTFGAPYGGNDLTEVTLSTIKLISQSYLGNETEEDAILPILPLIRETIVRSHARSMENLLLAGNHADGVYTSGAANGLINLAAANSGARRTQSATAFASEALTGDHLLAARKNMGKYGINPKDVVYIVSLRSYYELLQDTDFQDWTAVQDMSTKMTGEVGSIFGSKVMVCDEFATPAVSKYYALAVNTRNFVVPRLRGMRMESDYETANQRTVIVGSQRIGFTEIIAGATSVWGLQYKAS